MLSALVTGKIDLSDVLLLVAFIVFCVVFLLRLMATPRAIDSVLVAAGFALISLALFVL